MISKEPEDDALYRIRQIAKTLGITNPKIIGWDFSHLSQEQINVNHMHEYTAAVIIPKELDLDRYIYHHFAFEHQFCIDGTVYMKICVAIQ